ncbi:MAG: helix-turn-helix domain-containing protein, partial [Actinomycetota bacterium]|nr:helix-turn-helix domain-containing protein [Actinomycetota bacterium]
MRNEVRNLRTARGLSQQELAEAMDVSRQTIN